MRTLEALKHFPDVLAQRWRQSGRYILTYLCHLPRELPLAAGILPIRLLGNAEEARDVDDYFPSFFCHHVRSIYNDMIRENISQYNGLVAQNMCDTIYHVTNAMRETLNWEYSHLIIRPHDRGLSETAHFYLHELQNWKKSLEEYTGKFITTAELTRVIALTNENRSLLQQLYDLRGKDLVPHITGVEIDRVLRANNALPPQYANNLLRNLISEARVRRPYIIQDIRGPRVHISGSVLNDSTLFNLVEFLGGMVVSDDLCYGARSFWEMIDCGQDPLKDLAEYYLNQITCPCMCHSDLMEERFQQIMEQIKRYHVNGVIFCLQKYCDPHQLDQPILAELLKSEGLPVLTIEVERTLEEAHRTRVEAFLENM